MGWGSMDWIDFAEDRDQWRTLVNKVMNTAGHYSSCRVYLRETALQKLDAYTSSCGGGGPSQLEPLREPVLTTGPVIETNRLNWVGPSPLTPMDNIKHNIHIMNRSLS
jgi:hypothetical protein